MADKCWLCGMSARWDDPLDTHEIFNGPFRKKSIKYGLQVRLHHFSCHIFGQQAIHNNGNNDLMLKQWGQEKTQREQGWTTEKFIKQFGRNYL